MKLTRHALLLTALCALAIPARAENVTAASLLTRSANFLKDVNTLQMAGSISIQMVTGQKDKDFSFAVPFEAAAEKPNKFRYKMDSPEGRAEIVSDGTRLYEYAPDLQQVKIVDAPTDPANAPKEVREFLNGIPNLFDPQPGTDQQIAEMAKVCKLFGTRMLDGRETYVLQSNVGGMFLIKMWIGRADYVPYRTEMTMDMAGMMEGMMKAMSQSMPGDKKGAKPRITMNGKPVKSLPKGQPLGMKIVLSLKNVTINQPIPAETFTFQVPPGTKQVDDIKILKPKMPGMQ